MAFSELVEVLRLTSDSVERWQSARQELLGLVENALSVANQLTDKDKETLAYLTENQLTYDDLVAKLNAMKKALQENDLESFATVLRTLKQQLGW